MGGGCCGIGWWREGGHGRCGRVGQKHWAGGLVTDWRSARGRIWEGSWGLERSRGYVGGLGEVGFGREREISEEEG